MEKSEMFNVQDNDGVYHSYKTSELIIDLMYDQSINENEKSANPSEKLFFVCVICGDLCYDSSEYEAHKILHQKNVNLESCDVRQELRKQNYLVCAKCNFLSNSKKEYNEHISEKHKASSKFEAGNILKSQLSSNFIHKKVFKARTFQLALAGESHVCKTCGKSFSHKGNLNRHALSHQGPRNHICKVCGVSYTVLSSLTKHMISAHT